MRISFYHVTIFTDFSNAQVNMNVCMRLRRKVAHSRTKQRRSSHKRDPHQHKHLTLTTCQGQTEEDHSWNFPRIINILSNGQLEDLTDPLTEKSTLPEQESHHLTTPVEVCKLCTCKTGNCLGSGEHHLPGRENHCRELSAREGDEAVSSTCWEWTRVSGVKWLLVLIGI